MPRIHREFDRGVTSTRARIIRIRSIRPFTGADGSFRKRDKFRRYFISAVFPSSTARLIGGSPGHPLNPCHGPTLVSNVHGRRFFKLDFREIMFCHRSDTTTAVRFCASHPLPCRDGVSFIAFHAPARVRSRAARFDEDFEKCRFSELSLTRLAAANRC